MGWQSTLRGTQQLQPQTGIQISPALLGPTEPVKKKGCLHPCSYTEGMLNSQTPFPVQLPSASVPGALSELHPQLFGLPFPDPALCISLAIPHKKISTFLLRLPFIYKHHLQVLGIALVNGSHQWCLIRDIRLFPCLPLHTLFSCPVYVFTCNMHLFVTPLWGTKPGS